MDITEQIQTFREASRNLWNVHFRHEATRTQNWDLRDAFSEVYVALFNAMVRFHLPESAPQLTHRWDPEKTVLSEYRIIGRTERLSLMINRDLPASGCWDHPTKHVSVASVDLRLISLFDWDNLGFANLKYFRVRIIESDDSQLIDRDALAEVDDCKVEYSGK